MKVTNAKLDEYKNNLRSLFLTLAPKTNLSELNELIDEFSLETYPKRHMVLANGDTVDSIYFICTGMVRIYYTKEGKEITNWFIKENMMFAGSYALITETVNLYNYETIEDTIVLKTKYNTLLRYYDQYHSIEHLGRKMIERYYVSTIKRSYDIMFLSAEERFNFFKREHQDLLNRIPLRYIASYIGVTQETLSRLRAKH